jgi:uncharacterized protein
MECPQCGAALPGSPRFCPECGTSLVAGAANPASERPVRGGGMKRVALVLFSLVLIAGIALFFGYLSPSEHAVIHSQPVVAAPSDYDSTGVTMQAVAYHEEGGDLVFSLRDVQKFRLVRFEVPTATTVRPVMAYIAPDGRLVTAISVSEHCGSTEFVLRNNQIECAHCPSRWDMMTMEAYACCGKFYPDPVPSRVDGDNVRIPKAFVERWESRM